MTRMKAILMACMFPATCVAVMACTPAEQVARESMSHPSPTGTEPVAPPGNLVFENNRCRVYHTEVNGDDLYVAINSSGTATDTCMVAVIE